LTDDLIINPRSNLVPLRGKKIGNAGKRQEEIKAIVYWYYYPCLSLLFQHWDFESECWEFESLRPYQQYQWVWSVYCLKVKNSWSLLKGDDGVEFSGWLPSNSFHILPFVVSVFVVCCDVPRFIISEFTYTFIPVRKGECSLTMKFTVLPFPFIFSFVRPSECSLTISISIPEFPYILVTFQFSFSINVCSLTIFFVILPFSYIPRPTRPSVCSLTIPFPILKLPYILVSIRPSECTFTILFTIPPFTYILLTIRESECSFTMISIILELSLILYTSIRIS